VAGSADIRFSVGPTNYYNFKTLASLPDFTEQSDSYFYCRLNHVVIELVRSVDESTMLSSVNGGSIFLSYQPTVSSAAVSYALASRDQSAYKLDLMTFDKQVLRCPIYNIQYPTTIVATVITLNSSEMLDCTLMASIQGQLNVVSDNATVNAAAVKLFSMIVKYNVTFFYRN
jgi:hypothetical protein